MQPPEIRRATATDAAALAGFAARTFRQTYAGDIPDERIGEHVGESFSEPIQAREIADPDVATLLAFREDVLVAYAQARRRAPPGIPLEQPVELQRFYVDRPSQGRGVSEPLMAAVRGAARALGGRNLWLSVWERNPRAIAFYRKAGFARAGTADFHVGSERQTDLILVASIAAGGQDSR